MWHTSCLAVRRTAVMAVALATVYISGCATRSLSPPPATAPEVGGRVGVMPALRSQRVEVRADGTNVLVECVQEGIPIPLNASLWEMDDQGMGERPVIKMHYRFSLDRALLRLMSTQIESNLRFEKGIALVPKAVLERYPKRARYALMYELRIVGEIDAGETAGHQSVRIATRFVQYIDDRDLGAATAMTMVPPEAGPDWPSWLQGAKQNQAGGPDYVESRTGLVGPWVVTTARLGDVDLPWLSSALGQYKNVGTEVELVLARGVYAPPE